MDPKQKAKELVEKMYKHQWRDDTIEYRNAKKCAIVAVDEILDSDPTFPLPENKQYYETLTDLIEDCKLFWGNVKSEIEKL